MQQLKCSALLRFSRRHLSLMLLGLLIGTALLVGLALLVLAGHETRSSEPALLLALWSLLLMLPLGIGGYGALVLAGRVRSLQRFAPQQDRAEEGWTALLLAVLSGIWLLVIRIWLQPGPHSEWWIALWLLATAVLGLASLRRALVQALIRLLGPKIGPEH